MADLAPASDYPADRRVWGAAVQRWLAAGRPAHLELRREDDAAPPRRTLSGRPDGCLHPHDCESGTAATCRACAAVAASRKGLP